MPGVDEAEPAEDGEYAKCTECDGRLFVAPGVTATLIHHEDGSHGVHMRADRIFGPFTTGERDE